MHASWITEMLNLASFELRMNWPRTCECLIGNFMSMDGSLIFQILFKLLGGLLPMYFMFQTWFVKVIKC